jgi:hypothetical protein
MTATANKGDIHNASLVCRNLPFIHAANYGVKLSLLFGPLNPAGRVKNQQVAADVGRFVRKGRYTLTFRMKRLTCAAPYLD